MFSIENKGGCAPRTTSQHQKERGCLWNLDLESLLVAMEQKS